MVQYIGATNANGGTPPVQPAHNAGDLLIMQVSGKPGDGTVGDGASTQDFVLIGKFIGGTGAQGNDVGTTYTQLFAKFAADTTTTAPSLSGFANSNNATVAIYCWRPDSGFEFRDSIGADVDWAVGGSDATGGSTLQATTDPFPSGFEPDGANGDGLLLLGSMPSDVGSGVGTVTASATGLSGGTHTARSYTESTTGQDSSATGHTWLGFSGTPSTGITIDHTITGYAAPTGTVVAVAIRQQEPLLDVDLTGAATVPQPVQAGTLTAESVADLTGAATIPQPVQAGSLDVEEPELTGAATVPQPVQVGLFDSTGEVSLTGAATVPQPTQAGSLDVELVADLSGAATVPQPVQVGELDVTPVTDTLTGAAIVSQPVQAGVLSAAVTYGTDTSNRDDGLDLDGTAEVLWEPDVVPRPVIVGPLPEAEVRTVAHVIDTAPGSLPSFTPAVYRREYAPALRERVLIGDQDFTYFRGVPAQIGNLKLIDPLLYGSGEVTLPQVNPQFEQYGTGALANIFPFARVVIQLVDADDAVVLPAYYKSFISRIDTDGPQLVLTLGGQAAGRLSGLYVPPPVYRRKQDVEHILVDTLRDARLRAKKHDGLSGVSLIRRGGSDGLTIFNETLAVWAGATDSPITFTPNADGVYRKTVKDTETVHFTAYIDSSLISQSLSQDFMEQYTRVYARGFTAAGELVTNIKTPGLTQGEAPDFPLASGVLEVGMTDDDTDSGAGVTAAQQQLAIHDYLDLDDTEPGVYDEAVAEAVERLQDVTGLLVTAIGTGQVGKINSVLWGRLWDLARIGYSLDEAREYPTAEDPSVRKWNRTANGSKFEENPLHDPHAQPVDGFIDVGGPFPHRRIQRFARSKLVPEGGVWLGTLAFRSGLIAGEHNPGEPFTAADVRDRRELQPNHNVWLPHFMGGLLVTLTGVDHGPEETTALATTHPATTMETWAAIERRREAKTVPGRAWSGHVRASQVRQDMAAQWDTRGGLIANKVALVSGWNEVMVPVGQAGIVQRIQVQLEDAAEFATALTQKPVAVETWNDRVPTPLTDPRPSSRPWFERESVVEWLEGRGLLDAWGTEAQPCGYDPSRKTDELGPTAQAMTGLFVETVGFNYETGSEPVLYLYLWVGNANALLPGRILRKQDTTDF